MKFRFHRSDKKMRLPAPDSKRKLFRHRGKNTLRKIKHTALMRNYAAEDFGRFDEATVQRKRQGSVKAVLAELSLFFKRLSGKIKSKAKKPRRVSLYALFGLLCGAFSVALLSALAIASALFFKYNAPYTPVSVPNAVSLSVDEATAIQPDVFEYVVIYKQNPDYAEGTVTAQSPLPNVTRKLYRGKDKIKITLTVNSAKSTLSLPSLVGTPLRDALIFLQSEGINVEVIKQHSDSIASGNIISCSMPSGAVLNEGDSLTIISSLGKEKRLIAVPSLIGLSENEAISLIESCGFRVGEITYSASKSPLGTVISQDIAEGSSLNEQSKISFAVSGGIYYN